MFCPKGGRELSAGLLVCSECDSKMDNGNMISQNPLRKTSKYIHLTAVILGIIVLLIVFCPVGYRYYKIAQLKTKLEEVMEKDAAYMETVLKLETDSPNITYKEAFDLCDSSVEDRNKLIIELRALYPDIEYELKDDIINFLNAENELTRAKKSVYQRSLDLGVILDVSDEALAEIKSGITIFEVPYYREKLKTSIRIADFERGKHHSYVRVYRDISKIIKTGRRSCRKKCRKKTSDSEESLSNMKNKISRILLKSREM